MPKYSIQNVKTTFNKSIKIDLCELPINILTALFPTEYLKSHSK